MPKLSKWFRNRTIDSTFQGTLDQFQYIKHIVSKYRSASTSCYFIGRFVVNAWFGYLLRECWQQGGCHQFPREGFTASPGTNNQTLQAAQSLEAYKLKTYWDWYYSLRFKDRGGTLDGFSADSLGLLSQNP